MKKFTLLLYFILLLFLFSCDQEKVVEASSLPNIFVISLDTTRPDRLSCYGYEGGKTPNLQALAEEGILFEEAIAPVALTLPSHSSLFTGQYPIAHGVRANIGFKLPSEIPTLAEIFKEKGFQTAAFIGANVLRKETGLQQGFEVYDQNFPYKQYRRKAKAVFEQTTQWIKKSQKKPLFAWIHLFDPHQPYQLDEAYQKQFPYSGYDGALAYTDEQIGVFIQFLKKQKLYEESIIVIVGDHGEGLKEHGESTHGYYAYDSTLKIPFILKPAKKNQLKTPQVIGEQTRIIDIMPTLLSLTGFASPATIQGTDLTPRLKEKNKKLNLTAYSEAYHGYYQYGFSPITVLRTNQYKLIDSKTLELYHLEKDPAEKTNLASSKPELAQQLKEQLTSYIKAYSVKVSAKSEPDEHMLTTLGALGYLHSATIVTRADNLPDPKENLFIHESLLEVYNKMQARQFDSAQQLLNQVFLKHPDLTLARELQIEVFFESKQYLKASKMIQKILKQNEDDPGYLLRLAKCYYFLKDTNKSILNLKKIIAKHPNYLQARETMWSIYFREDRFSEVLQQEVQAVLKENPKMGLAWFVQGQIFERAKEFSKAKAAFKNVSADDTMARRTFQKLAELHQKLKEPEESFQMYEKAFQKEKAPKILKQLILLAESLKKTEKLKLYLENLRRQKPKDFFPLKKLIEIYMAENQKEKATPLIEQAKKFITQPIEDQIFINQNIVKLGKKREAIQHMFQVLAQNPFSPAAHLYMGQLNLEMKMKAQAIKSFKSYLELSPKKDETYQKVVALLKKLQTQ